MKNIKETLQDLFTENTGAHFLDSGGSNGRQWQKNQERNFDDEPEAKIEWYNGKFEYVTVNTYKYFLQVLDTNSITNEVNAKLRESGAHWTGDVDIETLYSENIEDIEEWGEGWNTYNHEYNCDHIFQGQFIKINDEPYVLLQLHLGADARGGYSNVQCFELTGYLTGNVDVSISKDDVSIDLRGGDVDVYNPETDDSESILLDDVNDYINEDDDLDVSIMICEDPCVY